MKHISPQADWPPSWVSSYQFDREEIYGKIKNRGYAYSYDVRRQKTIELLTSAVPVPAMILDIAAAQGNFSLTLAEMGYQVTWNDLRAELAGYVKQKYEYGNLNYQAGNAFELNFPTLFDAVLITEVIEHVAHPDQFLIKTAQLVRPGGYIVMTTPNGEYFRNTLPKFSECEDPSVYESGQFKPDADGHIFLLYPEEIQRFASAAGLVIERLIFFTNPLTNGHMKTSYLLRVLPRFLVEGIEAATQRFPVSVSKRLLLQMGVLFRKPLSDHNEHSPDQRRTASCL